MRPRVSGFLAARRTSSREARQEGFSSEGIDLFVFDWLRREEPHRGTGRLVVVTIRLP
jgi:hypothetical protein